MLPNKAGSKREPEEGVRRSSRLRERVNLVHNECGCPVQCMSLYVCDVTCRSNLNVYLWLNY